MIYGTQDYATEERNAWQRGDLYLAEVLGALMDAEESVAELEDAGETDSAKWRSGYDRAQEAWGAHNENMRQRLDNLRQLIEQAARVSGRELLLERIEEMHQLIEEA